MQYQYLTSVGFVKMHATQLLLNRLFRVGDVVWWFFCTYRQ